MKQLPKQNLTVFDNKNTARVNEYISMTINSRETEIFVGTSNGEIRVFDIQNKEFQSRKFFKIYYTKQILFIIKI